MIHFIGSYKKIFGITGLLFAICAFTAFMAPDSFLKAGNIENTIRWTALFGIISVGVAFVIMTEGIDLSIGSVVGLVGCILAMSLNTTYTPRHSMDVTNADISARTLEVDGDAALFKKGDKVWFLEKILAVETSGDGKITFASDAASEGLRDGDKGRVLRLYQPEKVSDELPDAVWRGNKEMRLRQVVLQGEHADIAQDDNLSMILELGAPHVFTVQKATVADGKTTVDFFVRPNQRVRDPIAITIAQRTQRMPTWAAILTALCVSLLIGLLHGLLITKLKLQAFVVTLCGLLIYRGIARYLTGDQEQGFADEYPGLKQYAKGDFMQLLTGQEYAFDIPMPAIYLVVLAIVAAIFLNKTIFGRYILALGSNEDAARYSGINTDRMVIVSYMICSFCAGLAGILFALDLNSIQPSAHGEFYELYAIAAAVLGGCSLRGGEGSILGVVIAAAVMRALNNAINLIDGIDTTTEFAIIGFVILLGVIVDETVRRIAAKRRASSQ